MTGEKKMNTEDPRKKLIPLVRLIGAVFILAGVALAFDLGGLASLLGMDDGFARKAFSGALIVAGLTDYFVIPRIFRNIANKKSDN